MNVMKIGQLCMKKNKETKYGVYCCLISVMLQHINKTVLLYIIIMMSNVLNLMYLIFEFLCYPEFLYFCVCTIEFTDLFSNILGKFYNNIYPYTVNAKIISYPFLNWMLRRR